MNKFISVIKSLLTPAMKMIFLSVVELKFDDVSNLPQNRSLFITFCVQ